MAGRSEYLKGLTPLSRLARLARQHCMTKIFLTGATGAIGARLLPLLIENGHEVVAMTSEPIVVAARSQVPLLPPPDAYAAISRYFGSSFVTVKAYPAAD